MVQARSVNGNDAGKSASIGGDVGVGIVERGAGIVIGQNWQPVNEVGRGAENVTSPFGASQAQVESAVRGLTGVQDHAMGA